MTLKIFYRHPRRPRDEGGQVPEHDREEAGGEQEGDEEERRLDGKFEGRASQVMPWGELSSTLSTEEAFLLPTERPWAPTPALPRLVLFTA